MDLTDIIEMYGLVDYYDPYTGNIYKLSDSIDKGDYWLVKVFCDGCLIGTTKVDK